MDLFPARIHIVGTSYSAVRVVVSDGTIRAWRLGPSGPEVVWERDVTGPLEGPISVGVSVPTSAGEVWVENGGGCACGSALANVDLFGGRQVVRVGLLG